MAWPTSAFPTTIDTISDKTDTVSEIVAADLNGAYDCLEKIEAKIGIDASAVATSLDYLLKNAASLNPAHRHTAYEAIFIPAAAMYSTSTNGAVVNQYEYPTNDINKVYFAFNSVVEQFIEFDMLMPEGWDRSTIKAKFFWSSATGSTAGDTVEWEILAGALSNDEAIDAALGTAQVISDALLANNGTDLQVSGATPAITVGGTPALGDLVHFKISRNVAGTDDMTEDAWLFGVAIQLLSDQSVAAW